MDGIGRSFKAAEHAVLERLCTGDWNGASAAREQLASSRYGGRPHPDNGDNCFVVLVDDDVPLIDLPDGAAYGLVVFDGEQATGFADLWIKDGKLSSVEVSWFGDDPGPMPRAAQLRPNETPAG